jgi:hypothetical protein
MKRRAAVKAYCSLKIWDEFFERESEGKEYAGNGVFP